MSWGSDTNDESKPDWKFLRTRGRANSAPKLANVHATEKGWALRHPWGDEVIVAIGGLNTNLSTATLDAVEALANGVAANAAAQSVGVLITFNEAVEVTGTPTVLAISSDPLNVANVTLTYDAAASVPAVGRLVFSNASVDLSAGDGDTLTVNASSTLTGWSGIVDAVSDVAVANAISAGLSASITISDAE